VDAPAGGDYYLCAYIADGLASAEDYTSVSLHVNAPPTVEMLSDAPDPVSRGEELTLSALGVADPDGAVVVVEFYRDTNGEEGWQPGDELLGTDSNGGDGWRVLVDTIGWAWGSYTYFARVQDDDGAWSGVAWARGVVNEPPAIVLDEPPPGTVVEPGDVFSVTWSDSDPDDDAQVSLWWDADTDSGNNLPGEEGVGGVLPACRHNGRDRYRRRLHGHDLLRDPPWRGACQCGL